jgi:hypothetical protein
VAASSPAAALLRSLLFSGFRAGGLVRFGLFRSPRSPSGRVLRLFFSSWPAASAFARRWSVRLGVPVVVRRGWGGALCGAWVVSVPVPWVPYMPSRFSGQAVSCWRVGGLRGFLSVVRRWSAGVV